MEEDLASQDIDPVEMLVRIGKHHGKSAVFTSSLGLEDMVITDMIARNNIDVEIATIDTGRLPDETYQLMEKVRLEMGVDIKVYFPERKEVEDMINSRGINLFYHSIDNRHFCCNVRKVNPLKNILRNRSVWITGIRGEQTVARKNSRKVEFVRDHNVLKVNPLLDWTRDEIWSYVKIHRVPYNILFDKNYKSIGCQPCTRAVGKDEDERSGRWWWEDGIKECGLHLTGEVSTGLNLGNKSGGIID
ncbi:MAG: phosphoadenylyl-sulfate reductase [Candidatus Thermoplasmatota archaeon]|jgi:phosphoadenosine phosphosulfate reductase|nr:phosphoadenylyl-sulfate reductase [Candidatus Thermoplasmatota archaeon]